MIKQYLPLKSAKLLSILLLSAIFSSGLSSGVFAKGISVQTLDGQDGQFGDQ